MSEYEKPGSGKMALERDAILDRMTQCLKRVEGQNSFRAQNILLAGPWGAGKTTLLDTLARNPDISRDYYVIRFSPWEMISNEDPLVGFLSHLELLFKNSKLSKGAFGEDMVDNIGRIVLPKLIVALKECACGRVLLSTADVCVAIPDCVADPGKLAQLSPLNKLRREFAKFLDGLAKANGRERCLLLIDDLDRTRPEHAVNILDALYHLFMSHPDEEGCDDIRLSAVWAVNITMLEEFLYDHYRNQPSFDATAYLTKLFHKRINVPPLYHSKPMSGEGDNIERLSESEELWKNQFEELGIGEERIWASVFAKEGVARALAEGLNFSVFGNLRLHKCIREQCCEYWKWKSSRNLLSSGIGIAQLVRDAQLIALVQAYPGFREFIAIYDGMWPEFQNRVNDRIDHPAFTPIVTPCYRHIDDPNLLSLLTVLGALRYDGGRYVSVPGGQFRLGQDLAELLRLGF